ncbi:hypothetical protein TIFTF001_003272 [Ficus carica]|uniref:Cellulose synthase-like protein G3 n=1 Tax=Ficus carica TaxID=3494 RepID=A0AA88CR31_FICCA|nr:hypothetical protein TIFTF001_003272 [Ficus carica]
MKGRVENVVERGKVGDEYISGEDEVVVLDRSKDRDKTGHVMPNLIYVSREKSRTSPHNFKAGALNVLIRVSATMTNSPIILTLDCDMYSNDPITPQRVLCYFSEPEVQSQVGYIQFPQMFHGINKNDTYNCEFKRSFVINSRGLDGLKGPNHVGTGCFFNRRAFFGGPSTLLLPELSELSPYNVVNKPIQSPEVLALAHLVAGCNFENHSQWGFKMGVKYGTIVEDFFTGYRLQCEGWKSIFCNPERAAFYGDAPISLVDVLNQNKRWVLGFLEVSESWFVLYIFLFLGAYVKDFLDFMLGGAGTFQKWWNDQRMWLIRSLSCFLFGCVEYFMKSVGISMHGFNVTSKVVDEEQSKRYEQGTFEFGVHSSMFVPVIMAAITNFVALISGLIMILRGKNYFEGFFIQLLIAVFAIVNCLPVYEAMAFRRSDKGGIPIKTTLLSAFLSFTLFTIAYVTLRS